MLRSALFRDLLHHAFSCCINSGDVVKNVIYCIKIVCVVRAGCCITVFTGATDFPAVIGAIKCREVPSSIVSSTFG